MNATSTPRRETTSWVRTPPHFVDLQPWRSTLVKYPIRPRRPALCRSTRRPATCFATPSTRRRLFGLREFGNIYTRSDESHQRMCSKSALPRSTAVRQRWHLRAVRRLSPPRSSTIVHAGQNFISATSLYGGTWTLFTQTMSKLGVEVRFFDPSQPDTLHALVDENTRAVYLETPGNPKNDVPDYRRIADVAHQHGLPAIIDNTVLTPALFRPIEHGFDIVVYSTTKFIGGHGVHLGGAIVDSGKFAWANDAGEVAGIHRTGPRVSRPDLRGSIAADRQYCLHHPHPHALAPRHGRLPEPLRRVPDSAGPRDTACADGAAYRATHWPWRSFCRSIPPCCG